MTLNPGGAWHAGNPKNRDSHDKIGFFWLTTGLVTVICTMITVISTISSNSSDQSGGSNTRQGGGSSGVNDVPSEMQGVWQGMLACPGCRLFKQVRELELHSGGLGQIVGETTNKTAPCTADVYLADTAGTALTLRIVTRSNPTGSCAAQDTVMVRLGTDSLWYRSTTGGPSGPLSPVR